MAAIVDYYKTLEISRTASKDEIRKAYKKLSKKHHPDANVGDEAALQKFKDVQQAWDVLGEDEKRKNYDQYGTPDGPRFSGAPGDQQYRTRSDDGGEVPFDIEELFSGFRSRQPGAGGARPQEWPVRGQDIRANVEVPFMLAAEGGKYDLRLQRDVSDPETLTVTIPAGIDSGSAIRLAGQGTPGFNGGQSGDLLVSITIAHHPWFKRDGANILLDIPITVTECGLGTKVDIPTLSDGTVTLTVPPGTSSGAKLRLKGKGLRDRRTGNRGDMFAVVKVAAPKELDERSKELLAELSDALEQKPRAGLWAS